MASVYGVNSPRSGHIDVSNTERGAKNYATRNGYTEVTERNTNHMTAIIIAEKHDGMWCKPYSL